VCVCVCVFFSFFLALSLTTIFPPSFVPCLNLLNSVGFDVCWLLWFFMPLTSWMKIFRLVHELVGEGDQWHLVIERCEDSIMYVFSLCSWVPIDIMTKFSCCWKKCERHLWCNFFVIVFPKFWTNGHMLIYTHDHVQNYLPYKGNLHQYNSMFVSLGVAIRFFLFMNIETSIAYAMTK
jgi:hypothetical protein